MQKIIVTTTINHITKALKKYASMKDWQLIIIGDQKTPHDVYRRLQHVNQRVVYIPPGDQEKKYPKLSKIIGWNCIQRRSIGYIEAYRLGADIIASVDDDNIPYDTWGKELLIGKNVAVDFYKTTNEVFDPLSVTNHNHLWHRGFPLELIQEKNKISHLGKKMRIVQVQADLWDGDPDIDAICRFTYRPLVTFTIKRPYAANKLSPFNSQNTFFSREVMSRFYLFPAVGRMDDIWGAYVMQLYYPNSVIYNKATVYQDRNLQSTLRNLKDELLGYEYNLQFVKAKKNFIKFLPERAQIFMKLYDKELSKV